MDVRAADRDRSDLQQNLAVANIGYRDLAELDSEGRKCVLDDCEVSVHRRSVRRSGDDTAGVLIGSTGLTVMLPCPQ
jgi:hypothetical protein